MHAHRCTIAGQDPLPSADTAPCVGCGLCCDGTIYEKARAQPAEAEQIRRARMSVVEERGKLYFEHPCRFSKSGLCTIYGEQRFSICHTYRCKLLSDYQAGAISREAALGKVKQALALRASLTDLMPEARNGKTRRRLHRELASANSKPRLRLAIVALDHYLDRWFRKAEDESAGGVNVAIRRNSEALR